MNKKPKCIIVSGRPGSGKTTLAGELSRRLYLPRVSRDEVKEGYVNTFGVKHDQLPRDTNVRVNDVFFQTTLDLLRGNVSVVIEAAFQHKNWKLVVPQIQEVAHAYILVCDPGAEVSARRHLERGLSDPKREFFHGDSRVSIYKETGHFEFDTIGSYEAPHFDVPTLTISTSDGYDPNLEEIERFIRESPNNPDKGDGL
jgi:predicted kinase